MAVIFYVYALIDPRNWSVFYIGKGKGKRSNHHLRDTLSGWHPNKKLSNKIRKLHKSGLKYEVEVLFSGGEKECLEKEMFWISFYGRNNLCNLTDGGEGCSGLIVSQKTRDMIGDIHRGKKLSKEHIAKLVASNKDRIRVVSQETREKIRLSLKGRKLPEDVVNARKGRKQSSESVEKRSKTLKALGRKLSAEHKAKMAAGRKGRKLSEEHKKKLSNAQKGKKKSEETKSKMDRMAA